MILLKKLWFTMKINPSINMLFHELASSEHFRNKKEAWNFSLKSLKNASILKLSSPLITCSIIYFTFRKLKNHLPDRLTWWEIFDVNLSDILGIVKELNDFK